MRVLINNPCDLSLFFTSILQDKWNNLEFVIVVLALIELMFDNISFLYILRCLRIFRVIKIVRLRMFLWKMLVSVLSSLLWITAMLLAIIFVFAVIGMYLFGKDYRVNACRNPVGNCEIPRWHFIDFLHR